MDSAVQQKHPRWLLVDFENVHDIDMSKVDGSVKIMVVVGANQKKMSMDLVIKNQKLGSRLEWVPIAGSGPNAADFFIAYQIGRIFDKDPKAECIILSKDTGFDPLIKMLVKEGKSCRRIENIAKLK